MAQGCVLWNSVVEIAAQETIDHLHGVAAIGKETPLLGTFAGVRRLAVELASPDLPQLFAPVDIRLAQGLIDLATG
ncbi:hypothetical protein D3C80_1901680 [compost metagenome]